MFGNGEAVPAGRIAALAVVDAGCRQQCLDNGRVRDFISGACCERGDACEMLVRLGEVKNVGFGGWKRLAWGAVGGKGRDRG